MNILLVDDHPMFVAGMQPLLRQLGNEVNVITAPNYATACGVLRQTPPPALVLLDLRLPDEDGFSALKTWSRQYPVVPIVILSASDDLSDMRRALNEGAMGFISKSLWGEVMLSALRLVLAGRIYVPQELVIGGDANAGDNPAARPDSDPARDTDMSLDKPWLRLTPRQREVFKLLVDGRSNKAIGRYLGCAEATVKAHVTGVLKTLGVANRTQAARPSSRRGPTPIRCLFTTAVRLSCWSTRCATAWRYCW